ncbi:MAG TPA: phosphopantetheine-binding protein [Candidatus Hydrogenedentes bacterium]|nr:phosphopantetheine-binding protein [Candidatus Hydrogenedentota bacterium]
MAEQDIVNLVNGVFMESFEIPGEKLVPEAKIFTDLGLDSLDIVDLVVALQKKFGVTMRDDERVRAIRTLEDIYNFIQILKQENRK